MAGEYYLGVDSGNTKTEVAILAADGTYITSMIGMPINMGVQASPEHIAGLTDLIDSTLANAKLSRKDVAFYGLGICGVDFPDELTMQRDSLLGGVKIPHEKAVLVNDGIAALWGGSNNPNALILQLGTAYTAGYRRGFGNETPFDPWNVGVQFELRLKILTTAVRSIDGREKRSILPELVRKHFEADDFGSLLKTAARHNLDRLQTLTVFTILHEALAAGDTVAKKIVKEAAVYYAHEVETLIAKVGVKKVDVVLGGGMLLNCPAVLHDQLKEKIRKKHPEVVIHTPPLRPSLGGAVMASFYAGGDHRKVFKRAAATSKS